MSESRTPKQVAADIERNISFLRGCAERMPRDSGGGFLDVVLTLESALALLRSSPPPSWRESIWAEIEKLKLESYRHIAGNPVADQIAIEWHNAALDKVLAVLARLAAQPETSEQGYRLLKPTPTVTKLTEGPAPKDDRARKLLQRLRAVIQRDEPNRCYRVTDMAWLNQQYQSKTLIEELDAALASPPPPKENT